MEATSASIAIVDLAHDFILCSKSHRLPFRQLVAEFEQMKESLPKYAVVTVDARLDSIRKACLVAEDLLESYDLRKERSQPTILLYLHKMVTKKNLFQIVDKARLLRESIEHLRLTRSGNDHMPVRQSTPCGRETFTVGLEQDLNTLLFELQTEDTRLRTISVAGMGGTGKTTLAGKVYTHQNLRHHFTSHFWISVSQKFRYKDILLAILLMKSERVDMDRPLGNLEEQELQVMVHQLLGDQRYLVVLDDVWKQEDWVSIKSAFPDNNRGSRLIITTRNGGIQTGLPGICHQMELLTEDQSKQLFLRIVSRAEANVEFPDVHQKLLTKCGGLPMAIVFIGRELKMERRKEEWERVYDELKSMQGAIGRNIYKILELSYENLPEDFLRDCFLRIGFFPEGQEISAKKLIYLWSAHDLFPGDGNQGMVDHGKSVLHNLTNSNMIQVIAKSLDGTDINKCRLHPLMHSFCTSMVKKEIFFQTQPLRHRTINEASPSLSYLDRAQQLLRPALVSDGNSRFNEYRHLHSLLAFHAEGISSSVLPFVYAYSTLLKVLYLEGMNIEGLPERIGNLRNLRYLNLCNNMLRDLPMSMGSLLRLLVLDVRKNPLRTSIRFTEGMVNLRILHIDNSHGRLRIRSPNHLHTLGWVRSEQLEGNVAAYVSNIQVLKIVASNSAQCRDLLLSLANLRELACLKLHITSDLSSLPEGMFSNMHNLKTLILKGDMTEAGRVPNVARKFNIPTKELERLPSLSVLKLKSICTEKIEFPVSEGGFPQLVHLQFSRVTNLGEFAIEGGQPHKQMPKLERLLISGCPDISRESCLKSPAMQNFRLRGVLEVRY